MSYEKVTQAKKTIIGIKQAVKAIREGEAIEIIIAHDSEKRLITPVLEIAELHRIPVSYVDSKEKLGKSCGIEVNAAVVAITE